MMLEELLVIEEMAYLCLPAAPAIELMMSQRQHRKKVTVLDQSAVVPGQGS